MGMRLAVARGSALCEGEWLGESGLFERLLQSKNDKMIIGKNILNCKVWGCSVMEGFTWIVHLYFLKSGYYSFNYSWTSKFFVSP